MLPFVPSIVPGVVQALVLVLAFTFACAKPLREYPMPFYLVFTAFSMAAFFADALSTVPVLSTVTQMLSSAYTGVAFYVVVMFAGAFDKRSPRVKTLLSVRSELSIIGGIIIAAHCIRVAYLPILAFTDAWDSIWGQASPVMFVAMGVVGPLLLVCFLIPWVTSFRCIRSRMSHKTWKKVQKLAYPFMFFMVIQGLLLAVGHAISVWQYVQLGVVGALYMEEFARYVVTAAVYAAMGLLYAGMKIRQALKTKERSGLIRRTGSHSPSPSSDITS